MAVSTDNRGIVDQIRVERGSEKWYGAIERNFGGRGGCDQTGQSRPPREVSLGQRALVGKQGLIASLRGAVAHISTGRGDQKPRDHVVNNQRVQCARRGDHQNWGNSRFVRSHRCTARGPGDGASCGGTSLMFALRLPHIVSGCRGPLLCKQRERLKSPIVLTGRKTTLLIDFDGGETSGLRHRTQKRGSNERSKLRSEMRAWRLISQVCLAIESKRQFKKIDRDGGAACAAADRDHQST
ncbi:hypothetical protein GEV33_007716 [Tenebrio molitor]|uniref:Uncharacterized protein n=1 Tax=Tenebrio molitor TaxID=7067 RepID=A0A8J6LIK2_TENMO|nr:hypothetical protein GEV33_007716 [Tenebrio molitor]